MRSLAIFFLLVAGHPAVSQRGYDTLVNLPDHYVQRLAKFKQEPVVTGKIMFIGNSITEGGNWKKLLNDSSVINRGISGDNTFGLLARITEITRFKPSVVFVLIGVNDLSKSIPNADILENIFSIVARIHAASPKTKIMIQSILPVNPSVKNFPAAFGKQDDIVAINGQLQKYGDALKYTFIDIHSHFSDNQRRLDATYTADGLHLTGAGYAHWVAYLKKNKFL